MSPKNMWRKVVPGILFLSLLSCDSGQTAGLDVDSLLFGLEKCQENSDCQTNMCSMGMCLGFLTVSSDLQRAEIGAVFGKAAPRVRERLIDALAVVLEDGDTSSVIRARAADGLGYLGGDRVEQMLQPALVEHSEIIRFFAARSLHALGNSVGTETLLTFKDHESEAVRILTELALADHGENRK